VKYTLNQAYATTRSLFDNEPEIQQRLDKDLPAHAPWGGLRKEGFFKVSTPEKPLITVVTVVYNGEKTLEATIQSVIEQTYDNVEYLIIDGRSTDGTLDVIKKYNDQIDFWLSAPDKGLYEAMNKGIFWSGNSIVAFLNSDDTYIKNDVLEHVAQCFIERPDLHIIYGKIQADFEEGQCTFIFGKNYSTKDLKKGSCPPHPSTFVRKEIFASQGKFDLQYRTAADYDFICKCLLDQNISCFFTDKIITQFLLGGASATSQTDIEKLHIIRKYFGLVPYALYKYNPEKSLRSVIRKLLVFLGLLPLWRKLKGLKKVQAIQGD
jgi:glycosyltransferase involved in cell wall biosynthesis